MTSSLPVIITPNAADDLRASWNYLRDRNPRAADEWLTGIRERECQVFCVWLIGSMLPERSKDDDNIERTAGRVAEGLQAA
jgi:hypothetical protein